TRRSRPFRGGSADYGIVSDLALLRPAQAYKFVSRKALSAAGERHAEAGRAGGPRDATGVPVARALDHQRRAVEALDQQAEAAVEGLRECHRDIDRVAAPGGNRRLDAATATLWRQEREADRRRLRARVGDERVGHGAACGGRL